MTPLTSSLAQPPLAALNSVVRLCWTSQAAGFNPRNRKRLLLEIDICSAHSAMVEAWVEDSLGRTTLLERQLLMIDTCTHDNLLHIDVRSPHHDQRIAALSFELGSDTQNETGTAGTSHGVIAGCENAKQAITPGRPLYAQTMLLSQAGFAAGSYEAPRLELSARRTPRVA